MQPRLFPDSPPSRFWYEGLRSVALVATTLFFVARCAASTATTVAEKQGTPSPEGLDAALAIATEPTPVADSPEDPITASEPQTEAQLEALEASDPMLVSEVSERDVALRASMADKEWERYARRFDRVLWKEASAAERAELRADCGAQKDPFCWAARFLPTLEKYRDFLTRPYTAPVARVAAPVQVTVEKGKVRGWNGLLKARLPDVLTTLKALPASELQAVAKHALSEKRCPNRVAVAAGALLEDDASTKAQYRQVARLFEKGVVCSRREPYDRDNYLQRASLYYWRAADYRASARLLAKARPVDAFSGRSLFWLYRSRAKLGDRSGAEAAYRKLRSTHPLSFHAILLALELGDDPGEKLLVDGDPANTRSSRPAVTRLLELSERLRNHGAARSAPLLARLALEKRFHAEPAVRLYLARLADANAKVRVLPALLIAAPKLWSRPTMEAAYPADFLAAAQGVKVDPLLLMALCRKESAFDSRAVSIADARGLCQLQPKTARLYGATEKTDLFDPKQNLTIAGKYLEKLLKDFDGALPLVLASYNAGEEAVMRWRKQYPVEDPILFLDLIPYRETRDYVAQVLANYYWYRRIHGGSVNAGEPFSKLFSGLRRASR